MCSNFSLKILGSSSAVPTKDRNQTAMLLDLGNFSVLFDAGEGVQKQFLIYGIKPSKVNYIAISHLHPDHFIGLIGLLCSWSLIGRRQKIIIVAPKGLQEIIEVQLKISGIVLNYKVEYYIPNNEDDAIALETKHFYIKSYRMNHRIECFGYVLFEKEHERRLLPEMLEGTKLPFEAFPILKAGKDYISEEGKIYHFADFTDEAPKQRSFAYFTDTTMQMHLAEYLNGVSMLYHDSTFLSDIEEKARETGHSTSLQAAQFAQEAKVEKLLLGHFSSRYGNLKPLEQEARTIFAETYLATEGDFFEVNLQ